jgi:hypothetical protein
MVIGVELGRDDHYLTPATVIGVNWNHLMTPKPDPTCGGKKKYKNKNKNLNVQGHINL